VGTITGGLIAFIAGLGLAGATVVGVVHSQQSAGESPVSTTSVSYGSNG
jgi:hypothetical protein